MDFLVHNLHEIFCHIVSIQYTEDNFELQSELLGLPCCSWHPEPNFKNFSLLCKGVGRRLGWSSVYIWWSLQALNDHFFSFAFPDVCLHVCLHTPFPNSIIWHNIDSFSSFIHCIIIIKLMDNCWNNCKIINERQLLTSRQHGKPLIQDEMSTWGSNQPKRGGEW